MTTIFNLVFKTIHKKTIPHNKYDDDNRTDAK